MKISLSLSYLPTFFSVRPSLPRNLEVLWVQVEKGAMSKLEVRRGVLANLDSFPWLKKVRVSVSDPVAGVDTWVL